jgi:hypothetical protein
VSTPEFLFLSGPRWIALIAALVAIMVSLDAWVGHYRSGFPRKEQWLPFVSAAVLAISAAAAVIAPGLGWTHTALRIASGSAVLVGLVGAGYHHWFGIVKEPNGYRWLLHNAMYGAPPLAPLALSLAGVLAFASEAGFREGQVVIGSELRTILLIVVAIGLAGSTAQAALLHYRGAFNTPWMYAPLIAPPLAVIATAWAAVTREPNAIAIAVPLLWLTFLTGVLGLGLHLRGLDRQMGGLRVFLFNVLQGPPAFAPAVFSALAAVGLVAINLMR